MKYYVYIAIERKEAILDPQGKAVHHGLNNLGLKEVNDVRIGKHISLKIEATSKEDAEKIVKAACEKLLANPVMEYFEFMVHE